MRVRFDEDFVLEQILERTLTPPTVSEDEDLGGSSKPAPLIGLFDCVDTDGLQLLPDQTKVLLCVVLENNRKDILLTFLAAPPL